MENKNPNREENNLIIPPDDDITVHSRPRPKAKRDIKENNERTRIDIPTSGMPAIKATKTPPPKKEPEPIPLLEEDAIETKSIFEMLGKGAIYFVFVLAASIILSFYIITVGNDIFAFVKDADPVVITVDEDDGIKEIASMLRKEGVIKYPAVFKIYNSFKNKGAKSKQEFVAGTYEFTSDLNYDELIAKFEKSTPSRGIVDITFPEGLSIDEMIEIFIENGIGTREKFVEAVKSSLIYDMPYRFLTELQELEKSGFKDGRKYALEGYIYPDTYQFYTDTSEIDAIAKLLKTFNVRFEEEYYIRCAELDLTVDEIVTIASIVQMETKYSSEYPIVSSLYHNRLNRPTVFPRLQCDSTYLYIYPDRRETLTLTEMKESENPYSTYSHDGLPPSAICNPSLDAIIAALYPNGSDTSGNSYTYYYMVARPNGYHYFAQTESEHLYNITLANSEKED